MSLSMSSPRFVGRGGSTTTLENCLNGVRTMPPMNGQENETDKEAVKMVQQALVDLGYLPTYDEVDGEFGPKTSKAISRFKLDRKLLPADGVVGKKTSEALDAEFPTRPTNSGPFATFVTDKRLDDDIADLLNELRGFMFLTWAGQTADFALHELNNKNLVGIVRAANAQKIKDQINPQHHSKVDNAISMLLAGNPSTGPFAVATSFEQPNWIRGFILFRDDFLNLSTPGDERHIRTLLALAHELTHFRNRVLSRDLLSEPITADNYVDLALADNAFLASGVRTESVRKNFIEEISCRHVSWRVHQDLVIAHAEQQIVAGVIVRPHALDELKSNLTVGRLFRAVLQFAEDGANPIQIYGDNGYMSALLGPPPGNFNRQVGLWFKSVERLLFHDDPTKKNEVRDLINNEFAAAQPQFATSNAIPTGMI
ncbi:peptidoglycan-binding domain-containing protein [Peribacillus butanolivorans]|uniref:peptidoglycan-binding domain-containing protein n=1 Tax=Peribacillus butanolivorans TaxID=421767 RepID=UPI0036DEE744